MTTEAIAQLISIFKTHLPNSKICAVTCLVAGPTLIRRGCVIKARDNNPDLFLQMDVSKQIQEGSTL